MSSEEMQAAIKKLEERIGSLKHTTDEKFLELDRENNIGVIMVSGRECPPRKRNEGCFSQFSLLFTRFLDIRSTLLN